MSQITLPVSLGEALDKLTILEIKLLRISDSRREDCQKEHDLLLLQLKQYKDRFEHYYKLLLNINTTLWDIQDKFHGKDISPEEAAAIAKLILEENDRRFRVKLMINRASESNLKEQKGYKLKKVFFYGHLGLGDMFWMNGAVRYLATAYDEVVIVCKKKNEINVRMMYADLKSIDLYLIEDDRHIQPFSAYRPHIENNGFTVLTCGFHKEGGRVYEFPLSFYDDLKLPRDVRQTYFHVPTFVEAVKLWEEVYAVSSQYIILQSQSSVQTLDLWKNAVVRNPNIPILDINKNQYEEGHPFFSIGQKVVGQPMLFYKILLEGAKEIYCIESSMYCFASHLDLSRVEKKYCYSACDNSDIRIGVFEPGPSA